MKSESKRILQTIQGKALNPITENPMFRTSDEVLEEALEVFYQHLKSKNVIWSEEELTSANQRFCRTLCAIENI